MHQQELLSLAFEPLTLEFLIPSYKRPTSLVQAILSIASQVQELELSDRITILIVDDASPNVTDLEITEIIKPFKDFVRFEQNSINKGMSLNIRDMVATSKADFCTILTDDDCLQPDSLKEIVQTLDNLDNKIGSFFVPRYSYLEDQSIHWIGCKPFSKNTTIEPNAVNSIKYMYNGFVLTGLFFNPKLINFQLWDEHIENSFFPVIYFADLLLNYKCLFLNKNWFIHTVLNECHWDCWGKNEQDRLSRLYQDYMMAITISTQKALAETSDMLTTIRLLKEEFLCYQKQMKPLLYQLSKDNRNVYKSTASRLSYNLSMIICNIDLLLNPRALLSWIKSSVLAMPVTIKSLLKRIIPSAIWNELKNLRAKKLMNTSKVKANKIVLSRQNSTIKLEIGAGSKKGKNEWITLDLNTECDIYWDLLLPLPFPPNSIDTIYSSHVLEHFYYKDLIELLDNCYKVLKEGGKFSVCVPDASIYINAYVNPRDFNSLEYCKYPQAFNFNSEIDYINYIAYMDGNHRYMFDSKNLIVILQSVGFKNVNIRKFDALIDKFERDYESIYAEAEK
ncbi:hypothetical protein B9G53_14760 [Pseudanabaena sp. SR411]|uniref:glycosyltransferase n=1 Tax=Pseudanabaena sp. SR411 TaxID=1980935 RepID=UPI000B9824B4|nr:glycosyltransferase [Pseudanabaena sp. SR411]OYQ63865.1 hypothetical protein B9G53_14760 [Pseudanabaena sp. SR411]